MKTVFLTGLNGLLGTNLCHKLLNNNFKVIGLLRDKNKYAGKNHENLTIIEGNLFDDFKIQFEQVDCIIHTAAITNQNILNYNTYKKINCDAPLHLINSAINSKVKQFIFVSSANTIGNGSLEKPGTEKTKPNFLIRKSLYAKSKEAAEEELLKYQNSIDVIIVNPTFMIGAYDSKPSSGKIITRALNKLIIFHPSGGKNFVHVKDVSEGIVNCISLAKSGEKYLLANENLSYKVFYKTLKKITKQKSLLIEIPTFFILFLGYIGDLCRSLGIKTSLSYNNMKLLTLNNFYSNKKSISELNVKYQPIHEAIKDAVCFFENDRLL